LKAIKIICIDLDGTLFDSRTRISKKNREAIDACIDRGIKIALTTGKSAAFTVKIIKELGLKDMHILSNGALIITSNLEPVQIFKIPVNIYEEVVRFFRRNRYGIVVHTRNDIAYYEIDNPYFSEITAGGEKLKKVSDLLGCRDRDGALMCTYAGVIGSDLYNSMLEEFNNKLQIVRGGRYLADIFSMQAGKLNAIKKILELYKIDRQDLMAIGDHENDIGIIKFAGTGIAMGNSPQIVKNAADDVVSGNDSDGVAEALYKYALD